MILQLGASGGAGSSNLGKVVGPTWTEFDTYGLKGQLTLNSIESTALLHFTM